jgi:hypothetical protein
VERTRGFCVIFILLFSYVSVAQTVEIRGKVIVDDEDIEGIHVINKTSSRFTITSSNGDFTIPGKHNDTIIFSAIKYKPKEVIIDAAIINSKTLIVYLTELVNELNQVIVGKILTGNLMSDIGNSDAKRDINFYDLGIPGYTGKPLTQSERKLNEAGEFKPMMLLGLLTGSVPLNPILNGISGRTKMLKNQVKLEGLNECLETIKSNLSELFFEYNDLPEANRKEFFYYCLEDDEFSTICQIKNEIRTLEFLKTKLESYKANLQEKKTVTN